MSFVSATYRISPDDITTAGTRNYMTGKGIHDASREAVLRGSAGGSPPGDGSDGDSIVWLVRDQYLRTVAPVDAGERIAILATLEDAGISAVRVCVRAIGSRGTAVACGFQTISCVSPRGEAISLPPAVRERRSAHGEPGVSSVAGSFAENAVAGDASVALLFTDEILALGARVAREETEASRDTLTTTAAPRTTAAVGAAVLRSSVFFRASATLRSSGVVGERRSSQRDTSRGSRASRRSGLLGPIPEFAAPVIGGSGGGVAFVFPGSDAYDGQLLRELYAALPYLVDHIDQADSVARRLFHVGLHHLVDADSLREHDEHLRTCPELAHLGAFLTGVFFADALEERGIRPAILVGHRLGELAALAVAGAIDVPTGLEIVANRALALRSVPADAPAPSRHGTAAQQLERALARVKIQSPRVQVYSPTQGGLYTADGQSAVGLASQLEREPDFSAAVRALHRAGCEYFVECGGGSLTRLIGEILTGKSAVAPGTGRERNNLAAKLAAASKELARRQVAPAASRSASRDGDGAPVGERVTPSPVAITGVGCVLPGANDAEDYWRNVVDGVSAVGAHEPFMTEAWDADAQSTRSDVMASASVAEIEHDPRLPFTAAEFGALSRAQQLVALAMRQCMATVRPRMSKMPRVSCILGASAAGMRDFEERSLIDGIRETLATIGEAGAVRDALTARLDELTGPARVDASGESASPGLSAVIERFVGAGTTVTLVDAACASSLYAIDLGMRSLRTMESDVVIVGGVFTPSPSWQPLYSLFEGLLAPEALPFDRRADGVVFGEGVVLLALRRLSDAMDAGDRIHGVIRGVGLSSSGKQASVGESNPLGQALALRRAYANAGVDLRTVQLIEGHGDSNPASDETEVDALRSVFAGTDATLSPRPLQSVKALVGHTVWAAGAASVLKVSRALSEHIVPPHQVGGSTPAAQLEESGFHLPTAARAWPPNADGEPRRAGVSAFGLGGANAHAVIEALAPAYHTRLAERTRAKLDRAPMAVVAMAEVGATGGGDESMLMGTADVSAQPRRSAALAELRPEVVEQLDESQLLCVAGAEQMLDGLANWHAFRERTGVVAGMLGRTARAAAASTRIYRDELRRLLTTNHDGFGIARSDAERVAQALHEAIGANTLPVNPHTLMGLLPNIAAARVATMFDFQGPNLVIDAGSRSILDVLGAAERWLTSGTADLMLACLLDTRDRERADRGEGRAKRALMVALTTPAFARDRGWGIRGELTLGARGADSILAQSSSAPAARNPIEVVVSSTQPLAGLAELAQALDWTGRPAATVLLWQREQPGVAGGRVTMPMRSEVLDQYRV